ncbi:MAG: PEGA domain-containing protein [Myxococcales bacterium]|nr:PEGA domain-containing protein [Myxococcales bacterium]
MKSNSPSRWPGVALLAMVLAFPALSAPPPKTKRISALVIPMDKGTEQSTLRFEEYMNSALEEYQGFDLKTSDELFGVAPDEDAAASLKRAEQGFAESKTSFDARNYEDAERKLRATIKEYGKAVAAMKSCGSLCDAVAMYAASLQARGEAEEAKIAILDLLALAPTHELDRKRYPQNFLALKAQVATGRNAQLRGNFTVKTKPAGARVYLDGEFQGYAPFTLQTLPVGKHLLRVERPGFRQFGAMIEVTPEDQELTQELIATSGYQAFDGLMDRLAGEAMKDKGGSTMSSVATSLKLDRAIIGVVRELEAGDKSELILGYFDLKSGKRLAVRSATFQGEEYGQLKGEVVRMVTYLVNSGEGGGGEKVSRTGDPLDGRQGTEDWSSEDRGGKSTKGKKGSGDPLEGRNGMEDW